MSAVSRLSDMGIEPYLIAGSLLGVVAQRLVRKICPRCKGAVPVSDSVTEKYGIGRAFRGEGCEYCGNTGYSGRFGLYEQFDITPEIRDAIASRAPYSVLRSLAAEGGMRTLRELGAARVSSGDTTIEEMIRVTGEG
jgi:type II secretory ATPase GspE/PulE/Tfp pilus assembly ATPase PilB-like protein